jgi:hypothetical protein
MTLISVSVRGREVERGREIEEEGEEEWADRITDVSYLSIFQSFLSIVPLLSTHTHTLSLSLPSH